MSTLYRITLLQLTADLSGVTAPGEKVELGQFTTEEVCRMAGLFLQLDLSGHPNAEPAILVRRNDRGWRISRHKRQLRVHHTASVLDDYWTVSDAAEIASLPPFHPNGKGLDALPRGGSAAPGPWKTARTVIEATGLIALGVVLMAAGVWFSQPKRRLSDLPPDVKLVMGSESQPIFATLAGTYVTGKKPGDGVIIVSADGRVMLGTIGKDGKPVMPPRLNEVAKAGHRNTAACAVTSFGVIAATEPDAVMVGSFRWRRTANTN